ncbi:DUF4226 domain-containing protein [Candidatus Mycolicibacterium alkanivorans]|uniref:DUF4226 domain-containing protein n=1 Tax=Candidatus Mycolicibacterium alkanivorans TaxID=2954114 RepID=A0ABS9YRU4_9MYCO|nr:DUF4226 domain-containing protein [Candidatus Mycolicibacterium alkanivorans]MCI4673963.1 DUF4226 domain-containing protein [Candidatus Mycolicibacterium alkanivorans]
MAQHVGESGESLASARAVLAARDRDLADADAELSAVVAGAYATATGAARRLEAIQEEIEAGVAQRGTGTPAEGREFARFLLARQHELVDIVTAAKADAASKAAVLQQLMVRYQ